MAGSTNAPFGMRPVEYWSGNPWNGATRPCVSETSNDALYIGDPLYRVVNDAQKTCGRYLALDQLTGDGTTVTAVDDQIFGVLVSHEGQFASAGDIGAPELLQSMTVYVPSSASPAYLLNVSVDANVVYLIQGDEAATDYTDAGKNTVPVTGTGSTVTGLSGFVADISNVAADASDSLLLLGILDDPTNLIADTYALWLCLVNIGWFAPGGYDPILGTLGV